MRLSLLLLSLSPVLSDIIFGGELIKPEEVFDTVTLLDSNTWWLSENTTKYYCIFRGMWDDIRQPHDYPKLARWSTPALFSSNKEYMPWRLDRATTWGVEKVAEVGSLLSFECGIALLPHCFSRHPISYSHPPPTSQEGFTDTFRAELDAQGAAIHDYVEAKGFFVDQTDHSKNYAIFPKGIKLNVDYPFINGIAGMDPSPDWFTGFYLHDVIDEYDRTFWNRFKLLTYPFDAGTDAGQTYNAPNIDLDPPINVERIFPQNAPQGKEGKIFVNKKGAVEPIAEWECGLHVCPLEEPDCELELWPPANGCDILKYPGCHQQCNPDVDPVCQECTPKASDSGKVFYANCCESNYEAKNGKCGARGSNGGGGSSASMAGWAVLAGLMSVVVVALAM